MKTALAAICLVLILSCSKSDDPGSPPGNPDGPGPQNPGNVVPLTITHVSPDSAEAGPITITGTGFSTSPDKNEVKFGGENAPVTAATTTQLTVTLPASLAQGKHDVSVKVNNNTATKTAAFHQVGWVVRIAAGTGTSGAVDGPVANATFKRPTGMTMDNNGNIYVADLHKIRKIKPQGSVSTVAGGDGRGSNDGNGTDARFNFPTSLVLDQQNNLYVADQMNFLIRKISSTGQVTTLAGTDGIFGHTDGVGTGAVFSAPYGLAINAAGTHLYVGDHSNHVIRKIDLATKEVTTIAGNGQPTSIDGNGLQAGIPSPGSLAFDKDGNLYITEKGGGRVRKMAPDGNITTVGGYLSVDAAPTHVAFDEVGNIYVTFSGLGKIKKYTPAGQETDFAGNNTGTGQEQGPALMVPLKRPEGIVIQKGAGDKIVFYFSDADSHTIKKIIKE